MHILVILHAQLLDTLPQCFLHHLLHHFMGGVVIHLMKQDAKIHIVEVGIENF
jgi:hypothetical protein